MLSGEVAAPHELLGKYVIASASDRMDLDLTSIAELLWAAGQRGQVSTAGSETSETTSSMHLVPANV